MSRKSIIAKSSSGGFNYQKEIKQLKKDLRLRDEKIALLNKELKYKQDTIDLLNDGMTTKDEQLTLRDKELINFESELKLLNEKIEVLERHNDELRADAAKQSKLAAISSKKQQTAETNNMNLLTQINSLAQNLNNLKNVNMALSSQLTMTMSAAQNTMQQQFTPNQPQMNYNNIVPNVSSTSAAIIPNIQSSPNPPNSNGNNNGGNVVVDESDTNSNESDNDNNDRGDREKENNTNNVDKQQQHDESQDVIADLPESTKPKVPKKRKSRIRSASSSNKGGSSKSLHKYAYGNWDDQDSSKVLSDNDATTENREREKTKRSKKNKDKDKPATSPSAARQKSVKKKRKTETEDPSEMEEDNGVWASSDDQKKGNQDDFDFGNAPPPDKGKKKRKKNKDESNDELGVYFDTYLEGIESGKLKITKGGRLVAMDYFTDSLYVISSTGFNSGKHEWEIKTIKTGDLADEIGVCSNWGNLEVNGNGIADMGSSQLGARAVYANDPSTGVAFHDAYDNHNKLTYDKKFKKKGSSPSEFVWSKGDIIKVALNCNKWSVKFFLNGKQVGKSIALTKELTYYPILCAYGSCSYQVVSYS